jgi:hypothetical protein
VIGENAETIAEMVWEGFRDWMSGMCKQPSRAEQLGHSGD